VFTSAVQIRCGFTLAGRRAEVHLLEGDCISSGEAAKQTQLAIGSYVCGCPVYPNPLPP
jgi:hypothetical protein